MALHTTFLWTGAIDGDLGKLGNYIQYDGISAISAAPHLPQNGDFVIVDGATPHMPGSTAVASSTVAGVSWVFVHASYLDARGSIDSGVFISSQYNIASNKGTCNYGLFYGGNNYGTVTADAAFIGGININPTGVVAGNAVFFGAGNGGTVTGNASFYKFSPNIGTVGGHATFVGNGYTGTGTLNGSATFKSTNHNGTCSGSAVFFQDSTVEAAGVIKGVTNVFLDNAIHFGNNIWHWCLSSGVVFCGASRNVGHIENTPVTFLDSASNVNVGGNSHGTILTADTQRCLIASTDQGDFYNFSQIGITGPKVMKAGDVTILKSAGGVWDDTALTTNNVKSSVAYGYDPYYGIYNIHPLYGTCQVSDPSYRVGYTATYNNNTISISLWWEKNGVVVTPTSLSGISLLAGDGTTVLYTWPNSTTQNNGVYNFTHTFSSASVVSLGTRLVLNCNAVLDGSVKSVNVGLARP